MHFHDLRLDVLGDQGPRRADGDQPAAIHDGDAVAEPLGLFHEMRGEHERLAFLRQAAQALPDEVPCLRVEAGGRLVHDEKQRIVDQRAGERQSPLHAAREHVDAGIGPSGEAGEFQQLGHARGDRGARHAEIAAVDPQILGDGEVGIEIVELRHDADAAARFARSCRDGLAEQLNVACVRVREAEAQAQRGGLARAVGTEKAEAFARRYVEVDAGHDFQIAVALAQRPRAQRAHAQ